MAVISEKVDGKYISIRAVEKNDADFIIKIRNDETKNQFLHKTSTDIDAQYEWIEKQRQRDGDYYFIISSQDGSPVGLASLYDYEKETGKIQFGRWISWGDALQNVETVILLFDLAFSKLGVSEIYMMVEEENKQVRNFWKRFGGQHYGLVNEGESLQDKTVITSDDYADIRKKNIKYIRY